MSELTLKRVAAGDMSAMQACIDTYGGLVWSLARRFSASPMDAEDAVQEVFIALWENAARFDEALGSEVTFVAMIARRRLIDRGRKRGRQQKLLESVKSLKTPQIMQDDADDPSVAADEVRRAREAMEELSENQRKVLDLAINHGLTHEQIAGHTGLPLGTVKTHARRGLMRVRELLQPEDAPRSP